MTTLYDAYEKMEWRKEGETVAREKEKQEQKEQKERKNSAPNVRTCCIPSIPILPSCFVGFCPPALFRPLQNHAQREGPNNGHDLLSYEPNVERMTTWKTRASLLPKSKVALKDIQVADISNDKSDVPESKGEAILGPFEQVIQSYTWLLRRWIAFPLQNGRSNQLG
ncbi:hypothetical protein M422DRAFT_274319 [Sphaerobolus stellatus SS14]|uniref:Uncharacterized protein n=1 Tax=Sphaerobolus stellatus (strain SS14) TaxID=990650 RepID=A0A0C9UI13_SPHS4|nr:hypothetical protein M422DRAFT_274319 [Sphaerobolus stellatus SS14]